MLSQKVINRLQYIIDSPSEEHGGFHTETVITAKQAIAELAQLETENAELRTKLLTAAGDDLCRLTQEEIKAMSLGTVKIPPKEEFLASCERFHAQVASEAGVMDNCLTLAQLTAENTTLREDVKRKNELLQVFANRESWFGRTFNLSIGIPWELARAALEPKVASQGAP